MLKYARHALLMAAALLLVGCAGHPLAPTPNLYSSGQQQPYGELPAALRTTAVDLLYVTDRRPEQPGNDKPQYGFHRSESTAYGLATVSFGRQIDWGQLVAASTSANREQRFEMSLEKVTELGRFPPTPWPYSIVDGRVVEDPTIMREREQAARDVHALLDQKLRHSPRKDVLVFVHGVGNSFTDSALTLAQMWHFLGRVDVPILYTWPAGRGGLGGYAYDRESGQFTAFHLKSFIKSLASNPRVERLHLVAHSRGTDVLMTAIKDLTIESLAAGKDPRRQYRIANVVLAAPDLDMEVVTQRLAAERLERSVGRITVYTSRNDKALGLSGWLFSSIVRSGKLRRSDLDENNFRVLAGYDNFDFIDYRGSSGGLTHGYFRDSPAVTSDLIKVITDGAPPGAEHGRPLEHVEGRFWTLGDNYLRDQHPR